MKPYFTETYTFYEINMYNLSEVNDNPEQEAFNKIRTLDTPDLKELATKAKELGYDTFDVKKKTEYYEAFNVEELSK